MKNRLLVVSACTVLLISWCDATTEAADQVSLARITVESGRYSRIDTPVCVELDGWPEVLPDAQLRMEEIKDSRRLPVPIQTESLSPVRLWWVLWGTTAPGEKRTFELVRVPAKAKSPQQTSTGQPAVSVAKHDAYCEVLWGPEKVLRYNHAMVPPPEGQSELYTRSGFIHPLWSPAGAVMTDIHPPDHIHHMGIWMPWTKTKFEGKPVDFWNLKEGQGTVRFVKYLSTTDGPVYGGFQAEQAHVVLNTSQGERTVLKEVWDVRVYNVGGPGKGYWLWDFISTQSCVADSPLYQEQYRYGGFGFRGARQWDGDSAAYLTSEGRTRKDGHGTTARWCDMSGSIDKDWEGVTIMSHPRNFRHPEPMRIWPEGQVFFNFAPSQAGDWVMEPGRDYVFRYRLCVHEGKLSVADAERFWRDYAEPPKITVERLAKDDRTMLFDGKDFSHWVQQDGKDIGWKIVDGAMKIVPGTGSIMTRRDFRDFTLHLEFKTPQLPPNVKGQGRGNSGVYVQRRYEVQILDSYGLEPKDNECASLYKFKAPDKNVCRKPDEWQTYDITFHAAQYVGIAKTRNARVTLLHNGVLVHDSVELRDKTGAGRPEGPEPGPILLQEHGSEVWFRNILVVPLAE